MPRLVTRITKSAVFTFEYRVDLTIEERNVLKRVDAFEHRLAVAGEAITVGDLVKGQTLQFSSIGHVLGHEQHVKAAAVALRDMMESLRALGLERAMDI